jgi:hypothetical protein
MDNDKALSDYKKAYGRLVDLQLQIDSAVNNNQDATHLWDELDLIKDLIKDMEDIKHDKAN